MWKRIGNVLAHVGRLDVPNGIKYSQSKVKGHPVYLFSDTYETVQSLRSAGIQAPSKEELYPYPGIFEPMSHQKETVAFLLDHYRAFCCNGLGTGKTLSCLWAAECLKELGQIRRVLIVAPKSAMRDAWERAILQTVPGRKYKVLKGTRLQKINDCLNTDIDYIVVNPESLHIIKDSLRLVDLVIADESTKFKTWKAQRTQTLNYIGKERRVWLVSATPSPQAPTDAYAQIRIKNAGKYMSFTQFRDMTMYQVNQYKWMPRLNAMDTVAKEMQPCIRFSRDECLDLPELSIIDKRVDLTDQQKKMVKSLQDKAFAELNGKTINAVNAAAVMTKILQIQTGAIYGDANDDGEKETVHIDASELLDAVCDIVEENEQPVLIYASFRSTVGTLIKHFTAKGVQCAGITADTSVDERTEIFNSVQSGKLKVLVAIAQTVAHGITLTNADTIVWVTPPTSFETYDQANGRIYRKGQTRKCVIYRIYQDFTSKMLLQRLDDRTSLQNTLLTILENKDVDI